MNPSLLRAPSARRGVSGLPASTGSELPVVRRQPRRVAFSPGIRLRPPGASCPAGCGWSVLLLAVGADAAGVMLSRMLRAPALAVVTFLAVGLGVLVHAWRHH
jgi:hypothetical protein